MRDRSAFKTDKIKSAPNNGSRFLRRRYLLIPVNAATVIALFGFVFMQLWNSLVPGIFESNYLLAGRRIAAAVEALVRICTCGPGPLAQKLI